MGRLSFVIWLHVMAMACGVIALTERSWAWFIGGIVLLVVATMARRLRSDEAATGHTGPRIGFVGVAMLLMLAVMALLFWLQFSV